MKREDVVGFELNHEIESFDGRPGVVDPGGQKSRSLANWIGVGRVWSNSKHAPSPEVNCTYLVLRYGDPSKLPKHTLASR